MAKDEPYYKMTGIKALVKAYNPVHCHLLPVAARQSIIFIISSKNIKK